MSIREDVINQIPEIPALPVAATEVIGLAQDPDSGISDIMRAIEFDPGLTSDILKLANTAYFAGPRQVGSLRDAGVLFGTQRIVELVLASSVFPIAKHPIEGYDLPGGELIRHSMALAIGTEQLAKLLDKNPPSHAFTSALLADIGKIVLGTFLNVSVDPILEHAESNEVSFEVAEREILGIDHAEVGALLLQSWNLPQNVIEVVRWHHDPDQLQGDKLVVDLVHVVNHLSIGCGFGVGRDGLNYKPSAEAVARLGVTHRILEQTTCNMIASLTLVQHQLPGHIEGV